MSSRMLRLCVTAGLAVAAVTSATAKAEMVCPAGQAGARLSAMALVHGEPPYQANLVPATTTVPRGYVNVWELKSSAGLVAVCRYGNGSSIKVPLPAGYSVCRVESSPLQTTAGCR